MIHFNIRSVFSKIDDLRVWATTYKPHVITLSETMLDSTISDMQIWLDDYVLYRSDRIRGGGGVATYVISSLKSQLIIPQIDPVYFECLFVKLILHENKHLIIGNFYRPPSAPVESIRSILSTINSLNCPMEVIFLGDFNWNWLPRFSSNEKQLFDSLNLTQLITEPTRVTETTSTLLDLIFVSHPERIANSGVLSDCFSDHSGVFCIWKIKIPRLPPKYINMRQCRNLNTENFIQDVVAVDWNRFQLIPNVEDAWNYLVSEFVRVIDKHAPWKTIRVKGRHLPWINSDLIGLFKRRDTAWQKYRSTRDPADWDCYKHLRNMCKTQTRNAKANYHTNRLTQDFKNPRQFWKRMNSILNPSKKPVSQIRINNEIVQDPALISDVFNRYFSSVGNSYAFDSPHLNNHVSSPIDGSFSFRRILPTEISNVISELKVGCASGPDGLEAKYCRSI